MMRDWSIDKVMRNIDQRLVCVRCTKFLVEEERIIVTQLPFMQNGKITGCVGMTFSFLCLDCVQKNPSAAEDVIQYFQSVLGTISDPDAWKTK